MMMRRRRPPPQPKEPSVVRFDATVQVREFSVQIGDVALCRSSRYCPCMCVGGLPVALDAPVGDATEPLSEHAAAGKAKVLAYHQKVSLLVASGVDPAALRQRFPILEQRRYSWRPLDNADLEAIRTCMHHDMRSHRRIAGKVVRRQRRFTEDKLAEYYQKKQGECGLVEVAQMEAAKLSASLQPLPAIQRTKSLELPDDRDDKETVEHSFVLV